MNTFLVEWIILLAWIALFAIVLIYRLRLSLVRLRSESTFKVDLRQEGERIPTDWLGHIYAILELRKQHGKWVPSTRIPACWIYIFIHLYIIYDCRFDREERLFGCSQSLGTTSSLEYITTTIRKASRISS